MNLTIILPFVALTLASSSLSAQKQTRNHSSNKRSSSAATQWQKVYTDSKAVVSIDPNGTIKHKDGTYTTHLRWTYAADQDIGHGKSYRTMREVRLLDCDSLSTKTITASIFDAAGKSVSSFDTPKKDVQYLQWQKRQPGTSANALAKVCQSLKK